MTQGLDELAKLLDEHEFFSKMKNSDKITLALLFTEVFRQGAASRQAEIDELQKRLDMYEREGYRLVPVEPTEEMIDAGVEESDVDWKRLKFAYQAMIGAVE